MGTSTSLGRSTKRWRFMIGFGTDLPLKSLPYAHGRLIWKHSPPWIILKRRVCISLAGMCVLCQRNEENANHLFFGCSYTHWVWKQILVRFDFSRESITTRKCRFSDRNFWQNIIWQTFYLHFLLIKNYWRVHQKYWRINSVKKSIGLSDEVYDE